MATAVSQALLVLDPVSDYEKLHRIGEGTYGVVYKARHKTTGQLVALKKVRFERTRDGVPVTSIRELRVLQQCAHPNIVRLNKVVCGSKADSVFLVFEYCEYDLGRVLDTKTSPFTLPQVKQLILQLLRGVAHLHSNWILHRDIKMSNLLYCKTGQLKLCDLGLARYFSVEALPLTPRVVTLWYRAPELLLGAEVYGEAIDMWAVGCVLGELLAHRPLFPSKSELECLRMLVDLLGTPNAVSWPGMSLLPGARMLKLPDQPHCRLHTLSDPHTHAWQSRVRGRAPHTSSGHDDHNSPSQHPRGDKPSDGWRSEYRHRQSRSRTRSGSPSRYKSPRHHGSPSRYRSLHRSRSEARSAEYEAHRHLDKHNMGSPGEALRGDRSQVLDGGQQHKRWRSQYSERASEETRHEPELLHLLRHLLCWDPSQRLGAEAALKHPWFKEPPLPCPVHEMPRTPIPESLGHTHGPARDHHQLQPQHRQQQQQQPTNQEAMRWRFHPGDEQEERWGNAFDIGGGHDKTRSRVLLR